MKTKKLHLVLLALFMSGRLFAQTLGLLNNSPGNLNGYVLFSPITSDNVYLIDKCGYEVHSWTTPYNAGLSCYLLEDGSLLRAGNVQNPAFNTGGTGGIIERYDWNNNLTWSYQLSDSLQCQHHDFLQMPNGNILVIAWDLKTNTDAIAAGRNPANTNPTIWMEKIVELQPVGSNSANIVWEWRIWDHLIQEFDATKQNYGNVSQHPELLDINTPSRTLTDWLHCNSVDYNPSLDQIMISVHSINEIWIIDHSTTTLEAKTHSGGLRGKGGDLLYRWGNPLNYHRGNSNDTKFWGQHNAHWIRPGFVDEGKVMVFNNGQGRVDSNYSSVEIIEPPISSPGNYSINPNLAFGPDSAIWKYEAPVATDFFAAFISGAQRLSNGNTLICSGPQGDFFEIDGNKNKVWEYINPVSLNGILSQDSTPTLNSVFRTTLYEPTYNAFVGKNLTPGDPIELNFNNYNCSMITGILDDLNASSNTLTTYNANGNSLFYSVNREISEATVSLYDLNGRMITLDSKKIIAEETKTELILPTQLATGLYTLKITSSDVRPLTKLIYIN